MSDFSGFEFTLGSVRGLRAWTPDEDGLRSVSRKYIWTADENRTHCYQTQVCDCADCRAERDAMRAVAPHRMETCECGFYAYFAPQIDLATATYVSPNGQYATGVIEGFGRTIIGSKGFRAERARILALSLNGEPDATSEWQVRYAERRKAHTALAARRLGVPLFESVELLLAEFPTSSADEFARRDAS